MFFFFLFLFFLFFFKLFFFVFFFFFVSFSKLFNSFLSSFASPALIISFCFATFISDFAVSLKTLKSSLNCFRASLNCSLIVFRSALQFAFICILFSGVALLSFSLHSVIFLIVRSLCGFFRNVLILNKNKYN